jgi:hypothetical protein
MVRWYTNSPGSSAGSSIDRERGFAALVLGDGDLVLLRIFQQPGPRGQLPFTPGGNDFDIRVQGVVTKLEADLIIALAGGAVGDGIGAHQFGDFDLPLGDQRPGDRGAEQVLALVQRIGAEHRKDKVFDEGFTQILDENLFDAEKLGLFAGWFKFLALAQIGGERHNLTGVGILKPAKNNRGVQPAGIGEDDFFHIFDHAGLY